MNLDGAQEDTNVGSRPPMGHLFSREQLMVLVEHAPVGFIIVDAVGTVVDANLQAEVTFGYEPGGLVGKSVEHLVDPAARENHGNLRAAFHAAPVGSRMGANRDLVGIRKDGSKVSVEVSLNPVLLDGRPFVLACVADITVRKQAEEAVTALNAKLLESENRFKLMANGAPAMIWISDADGNRTFFNNVWLEFRGRSMEQELGVGWLEGVHPDERTRFSQVYLEALLERKGFELDYRLARADGTYAWVFARGRPRFTEDGSFQGLVGCCMDITVQRQLAEEKRRIDEKLMEAAKLESLGVLAGGIAHDFNNLLTGILGNASLARLELTASNPAVHTLDEIELSARRAADLCRQMLAYSGRGRFVIKDLGLNELIEETVHLLQISISKQCVLRFHLAEKLPSITGDATQLRQIVMNLVINASEAIGTRSGVVAIGTGVARIDEDYIKTVRHDGGLQAGGTYVYLEVSDNGSGMSPETLDKVFDPFFTTKFSGRGLGLAAVLGIVRGHKGGIKVYSEKGKGTTFKLYFPSSEIEAEKAARPAAPNETWRGEGVVLVVDDEETIRSVAARMLEKFGFQAELAADGREAIEKFKKAPTRYTMVFLDLTMPHLDGEETFRQLRHLNPGVRVLLTSGFNQQEAVERFAGKGLAGFVQKPFEFAALREAVRQTILSG